MTALVGIFGPGAGSAADAASVMLRRMRNRGAALHEEFRDAGVHMAARRYDWEPAEHGWAGPLIVDGGDWVVAADASLYYLADLRRRLSWDERASNRSSLGDLVVAALRAWGDRFANYLEGDFAILAWHRPSGRLLLARDFVGKRSLAYGMTSEGTLVVASSPRAVTAFPGISKAYDAHFIATSIAALHGHGHRTAFADVSVVPGGATLSFEGRRLTTAHQWLPPGFSSEWTEDASDDAADRLRWLLEEAVAERLPDRRNSAVWMSGGWDSTSVFAAGRAALGRRRAASTLLPISMRYPEGDTGDEARFIQSIAQRWSTDVRWVPVDSMPLFEDAARRAAIRDDPRVSPFETQIRTLCAVTREAGIRVALDGAGGDHLFMVSSAAILSDHLLAGRLNALWNAWSNWGKSYRWTFARSTLLPLLSAGILDWIGTVRGRPLRGFWQEDVPPWVRLTPELRREAVPHIERDPDEGVSAWETRRLLTTPLLSRALSWTHPMALEEGVLLRSPLFDRRLIEFTATRPLNERGGGIESKVILRRAMRDLLPADVLAGRSGKTGTPADYFKREMRAHGRREFNMLFSGTRSRLNDLGVIDLAALRGAMDEYDKSGIHGIGALIQLTIEAERWLAAQEMEG